MFARPPGRTINAATVVRAGQKRFNMSRIININKRLDNWLRANRQWGRAHNMQHARFQWEHAELPETAMFWQLILERLED